MSNIIKAPLSFSILSFKGSKSIVPAITAAAINSGEPINARVSGLPSFLDLKLRLKEVIIEFGFISVKSLRTHCPIQGPQEFENNKAPKSSNIFKIPSLSMVFFICSEPGEINRCDLAFNPFCIASFKIAATLVRSS